jgi:hypothetical protein
MSIKTNVDEVKVALVANGIVMVDKDAALMAAYQLGVSDAKEKAKPVAVAAPKPPVKVARPAPAKTEAKKAKKSHETTAV